MFSFVSKKILNSSSFFNGSDKSLDEQDNSLLYELSKRLGYLDNNSNLPERDREASDSYIQWKFYGNFLFDNIGSMKYVLMSALLSLVIPIYTIIFNSFLIYGNSLVSFLTFSLPVIMLLFFEYDFKNRYAWKCVDKCLSRSIVDSDTKAVYYTNLYYRTFMFVNDLVTLVLCYILLFIIFGITILPFAAIIFCAYWVLLTEKLNVRYLKRGIVYFFGLDGKFSFYIKPESKAYKLIISRVKLLVRADTHINNMQSSIGPLFSGMSYIAICLCLFLYNRQYDALSILMPAFILASKSSGLLLSLSSGNINVIQEQLPAKIDKEVDFGEVRYKERILVKQLKMSIGESLVVNFNSAFDSNLFFSTYTGIFINTDFVYLDPIIYANDISRIIDELSDENGEFTCNRYENRIIFLNQADQFFSQEQLACLVNSIGSNILVIGVLKLNKAYCNKVNKILDMESYSFTTNNVSLSALERNKSNVVKIEP
ncbi:hypothetical protein [Vibrio barjaei]|uniref:hypothetical protein n=1 Tax=Vibrio barjaei TaxID=1676683 RepID=UPI002284E9E0|nr:hypothetical protein [Vibrio barjaei]MCY9874825.1 hypothetical protein [Vibrio barjaei]